jgi:hypothetical protein
MGCIRQAKLIAKQAHVWVGFYFFSPGKDEQEKIFEGLFSKIGSRKEKGDDNENF